MFQLYCGGLSLVEVTGIPGVKHWPAASHWQLYHIMAESETIWLAQFCGTCMYLFKLIVTFSNFLATCILLLPILRYKEGKLLYQADRWKPLSCLGGREMLIFKMANLD